VICQRVALTRLCCDAGPTAVSASPANPAALGVTEGAPLLKTASSAKVFPGNTAATRVSAEGCMVTEKLPFESGVEVFPP